MLSSPSTDLHAFLLSVALKRGSRETCMSILHVKTIQKQLASVSSLPRFKDGKYCCLCACHDVFFFCRTANEENCLDSKITKIPQKYQILEFIEAGSSKHRLRPRSSNEITPPSPRYCASFVSKNIIFDVLFLRPGQPLLS